ncbi:PHD finger protein ALFIN-LIKE 8 [Carex littledalei]|uniref:PHD finger protein ALFIN-LIKE n=1 Tax=Carex littledalei TaxID=544730 RepID=A0A833RKH6_9POAL|nr:PHD finger protein ALFIN-LIKE 8 [Carex littledalei]
MAKERERFYQDEEIVPTASTSTSSDDPDFECEINSTTKARTSHTIRRLFRDFKARRAGILKALTTEAESFYRRCDPEKDELGLYGLPNGTWDVKFPEELVPPDMPEPTLGINFARYGSKEEWLAIVAVHSDSWLLALTFYLGSHYGLDQESRRELFSMINNLPTIYEVVTGAAKKPTNERTPKNSSKSNKSASQLMYSIYVSLFCCNSRLPVENAPFLAPKGPAKHRRLVIKILLHAMTEVKRIPHAVPICGMQPISQRDPPVSLHTSIPPIQALQNMISPA